MHVVAPKEASTCRSKGPKGEWIERTYDYVIASGRLKGKISLMEVVEDVESRPHKAVSLVVKKKRKEIQEWNEQKLPKVLPGYSGGRLPGRSAKAGGREEEEEDENSKEKKIRYEIAQEVVAVIKEKTGVHEDAKSTAQRTVGQSVKQSWGCSQIDSQEEEEEEYWQRRTRWKCKGLRMRSCRRVWNEEGWKEVPLQAEVMQKVPELVVHERMPQGKGVKRTKEKKTVKYDGLLKR